MKKKEIIAKIEKTIKKLSKEPKEADTIKALQKQILSMKICNHGTEKNCLKCGGKRIVECSNSEVKLKSVSAGYCQNCKYCEYQSS